MGRDSSVGIATCYGLGGPGIESWWGTRFSAPFQTGPGAHPTSCRMGTGSFPGVKRPGPGVDHQPPYSVEVEGRVELYLQSPPGPSWPVGELYLYFVYKGLKAVASEQVEMQERISDSLASQALIIGASRLLTELNVQLTKVTFCPISFINDRHPRNKISGRYRKVMTKDWKKWQSLYCDDTYNCCVLSSISRSEPITSVCSPFSNQMRAEYAHCEVRLYFDITRCLESNFP